MLTSATTFTPLKYDIGDYSDVSFFAQSVQSPTPGFDILDYLSFSKFSRSATFNELQHSNSSSWFYFARFPKLWNALPVIDLSLEYGTIKDQLYKFYFKYFNSNFDPNNYCSYYFMCPCAKCSCRIHSNFTYISDI